VKRPFERLDRQRRVDRRDALQQAEIAHDDARAGSGLPLDAIPINW
jgi:hypothetical protein